ncbi:MAG: PAS domain-containing protein [Pirellulaceae bacterium]|nr:PAS domain-containing protein [Pirellulaceae bacterium]
MTQQESKNRIARPKLLAKNVLEGTSSSHIREAEDSFLAEVARSAGFGTYSLHLSSGECECSGSLKSILRLEPHQNAHDCLEQGVEPSQRVLMEESLARLVAAGGDDCFEHSFRLADGSLLTLLTRRRALRDGDAPAHTILCSVQDVSERKVAFGKLRESEFRYRTLMDFATDSFILHAEGGLIVDVNQRACETYRYSKEEFIGQYPHFYAQSLEPDKLEWIFEEMEKGHTVSYDSIHRRKDGSTFPTEVRIRPIVLDGKRYVVLLSRDITDRKNAELELRKSEGNLRLALDTAQIGSWRYQLMSNEIHLDARCQQHLGLMQSIATVDQLRKLIHPADLALLESKFKAAAARRQSGDHVNVELRVVRPDGAVKWISAKAILHFGETEPGSLIGTTLDITDQRNAVAAFEGQSRVFEQIATGQSLTSILDEITLFVEQLIPDSVCYMLLADNEGKYLRFAAGARAPAILRQLEVPIADQEGACGSAAWSRDTVVVENTAIDERFSKYRAVASDLEMHSCWSSPIFEVAQSDDAMLLSNADNKLRVVGTLAVCRKYHGAPDDESRASMETAVRLAEIAISRIRAVQDLRESEVRYTVMSEISRIVTFGLSRSSGDGFWLIDWSRPQVGLITGFGASEILGASWKGLIHPEDHDKCDAVLANITETLTSKLEARLMTKSGQAVDVQIHLKLDKYDPDKGTATLIGGLLDISEFKAVELALRKSEERFELAVSGTNDGLWDWNLLTNELYYSPRWKSMLGYEPHELGNDFETWTSLLHPDDADLAQSKLREFLDSQSTHFDLEFRMRTKHGDYRTIQSKANLSRDANGLPIRLVGTHRDLTERNAAELALRRSEEFLRRAQVIAHVGNWTLNLDTQEFDCSEEAARIFELEGRTCTLDAWLQMVHPDDLPRIRSAYAAMLAGENFELEYRLVFDGRMKWVSSKATLEMDGTFRTPQLVGVTQDISARTKLEEQLRQSQKMDAFGQLAGGVAHDFNNLLTVINGFASLLLDEIPPGEMRREYVEQIQQAGERAAALTRQLLTLGRREFTEPRIIDLNAIASRSETMLKRLIGENIIVRTHYFQNLPSIKADPGQIDQVILNLAVNARDAMPNGGRMTISTSTCIHNQLEAAAGLEELPSGEYVQFQVSDTGVGMTEDVKARIFEPFFSTKGVGKGTGLGLSTVYGIVKQNNGAITVESEPGAGATFRILFPIEKAQVPVIEKAAPTPIAGGTETILLAEDEDLVRNIVITTLESQGYKVLAANSGEEALELANQYTGPLHMLITDMVMPGITGTQLAERMKDKHSDLRVLYMSGYTEDKVVRLGLFSAPDDFIQKPFTPAQLNRSVHQLLQNR